MRRLSFLLLITLFYNLMTPLAFGMVKCPFCGFSNEDGALFCEQCKSDISSVSPSPAGCAIHNEHGDEIAVLDAKGLDCDAFVVTSSSGVVTEVGDRNSIGLSPALPGGGNAPISPQIGISP